MAKLLPDKGCRVFSLMECSTSHVFANLDYFDGDMIDEASLIKALKYSRPDEIYNLAAQSFVGTSWRQPVVNTEVNAVGVLRLRETVRNFAPP